MNDDTFTGQTAIITGAARGIGLSIAAHLARDGASVVLADADAAAAEESADRLRSEGLDAIAFAVDVTDADGVEAMVAAADGSGGGLRMLVNNAAISTTTTIEDTSVESWRRVLDINLTGPFLCATTAVPVLRRNGGGRIVNVASVAGKRISYNTGASYTASKAGLLGFTRHLAYEVARDGITVNAICPGPVATPMLLENATEESLRSRIASVPVGRLSTADDQAQAVAFLCSPDADFITGVALDVDGGSLLGWYDVETYFARRGH